jgi:hypothetical protein
VLTHNNVLIVLDFNLNAGLLYALLSLHVSPESLHITSLLLAEDVRALLIASGAYREEPSKLFFCSNITETVLG